MTDMNLKTVKSRLIIKKKEVKQTTESGIILSGGTRDEDQWAEVISVGPDVKSDIAVGDSIVPMWNTVALVKHMGDTYYIVSEDNIVVVLK